MLKKRGFRKNELYSQMGFYFQMKKSMGILEIDDWKKEYVKKIKLKKNMRTRTIDSSHHVKFIWIKRTKLLNITSFTVFI